MRAYYFDDLPGDVRLPHDSGRPIDARKLDSLNIRYWHVPVDSEGGWEVRIDELSLENNFKCQDKINVTKEAFGDKYEDILKEFFDEHLHEDDEIRYVVEGGGYYDVREHPTDDWIRVHIGSGDLIAVPKGIYHRFMLDEQDTIAGLRLWRDVPNWTPLARSDETDKNPYRISYLRALQSGSQERGLIGKIGNAISNFVLLK
ncbi:1,2-dihydroxy-3-keto-5-methylthiopentene dioxygenase [Dentipellis sp. KUC8613]|nr:1,2-dihydroxy-3-keto-5-methylthiopentene dioxygenase [Dentipellis sp. KUC8613]